MENESLKALAMGLKRRAAEYSSELTEHILI